MSLPTDGLISLFKRVRDMQHMQERKPFEPSKNPSERIVTSLELKDYKEEKDGKEDKHAKESKRSKEEPNPEPYISYKPFVSTDTHIHTMSFLEPDAIKWRAVNREWRARNEISYWQKFQKKLPANLDKRAHVFLRLMCAINKMKFIEVVSFIENCYENFKLPEATSGEVKKSSHVRHKLEDAHFKLFEAIVKGDVAEFMRITSIQNFDVNYLIGYLSPLMLAELFPQKIILQKLEERRAEVLPSQIKLLLSPRAEAPLLIRVEALLLPREEKQPSKRVYFISSLLAIKYTPIITEIMVRYFGRDDSSRFHQLVWYGIAFNKPLNKLVSEISNRDVQPFVGPRFYDLVIALGAQHRSVDSESHFGKNSASIFTTLLRHPANVDHLNADVLLENNYDLYDSLSAAASISAHMLRPFLAFDPDWQMNLFRREQVRARVDINDLATSADLDCAGELVSKFPDNKFLRQEIVRRIIERIRLDSVKSRNLDFTSYEKRYESIVHTLNDIVTNHPEDFVDRHHFFSVAMKYRCHELLQALDKKMMVPSPATDVHLGPSFLFSAVYASESGDVVSIIQALLEFEQLDVNACDSRGVTALGVLIGFIVDQGRRCAVNPEQYEIQLKAAELLVAHPRVRLELTPKYAVSTWHLFSDKRTENALKRLLLCVKSRTAGAEVVLLKMGSSNKMILETLLPAIKLGSHPDLLTELFMLNDNLEAKLLLLQRPDLVLSWEDLLGCARKFLHWNESNLLRFIIIHPGLGMTELGNEKVINKEFFEECIFPHYFSKDFNEGMFEIICSRHFIGKAETALISGKLSTANDNFNKARKRDSELLDIYMQQVMEKFPSNYRYTPEQRQQLYSLPAILQSSNASTLLLLAKHHAEKNPALAEILCARALRSEKITSEERIAIEAQMKIIANSPEKEYKLNPRELLLAIATKATKKIMGVYRSPHEELAHKIIDLFKQNYEKPVERQFLLNKCNHLIEQGVSIQDPFFAALLTMIESMPILMPKLECKAVTPSVRRVA